MDIIIDIIFVCAFYLELIPEWSTTFTRKDREPHCYLLVLFVVLVPLLPCNFAHALIAPKERRFILPSLYVWKAEHTRWLAGAEKQEDCQIEAGQHQYRSSTAQNDAALPAPPPAGPAHAKQRRPHGDQRSSDTAERQVEHEKTFTDGLLKGRMQLLLVRRPRDGPGHKERNDQEIALSQHGRGGLRSSISHMRNVDLIGSPLTQGLVHRIHRLVFLSPSLLVTHSKVGYQLVRWWRFRDRKSVV